MKRKFYSVLAAGMLSFCIMSSSLVPVYAKEVSSHASCDHMTPPELVEVDDGYRNNNVSHWKQYTTVARCVWCGETLAVVSQRKAGIASHDFDYNNRCKVCHFMK